MIINTILLVLVAVLAYAWIAYPSLLALADRLMHGSPKSESQKSKDKRWEGNVVVVLAAHNEEEVIKKRLENLVSFSEISEIHVGLDGCRDGTAEVAKTFAQSHGRVHVHEFDNRRGKVSILKDVVRESKVKGQKVEGERRETLLVFTDANTEFKPDALQHLLKHFDDPAIGGVCGRLVLVQGTEFRVESSGESDYWTWENRMKERDSKLDSCIGANGAIYAIRQDLFWNDFPENTIVDDLDIGTKVREQGYRFVYEPDAVAEEELPTSEKEWGRRVRIGAGDYQALGLCKKCLLPKYGWFSWAFWSHKVLRWFTPHILVLVAVLAIVGQLLAYGQEGAPSFQIDSFPNQLIILTISLLLLFALAGRLLQRSSLVLAKPFILCSHFVTMQCALFVGFLKFCRGNLKGHWDRTGRQ